jgi:hypothetical protein
MYVCMYMCVYVCMYCTVNISSTSKKIGGTSLLTDALDARARVAVQEYVCLNYKVDNLLIDKEY